jgi:DNA-binding CsgD family transcriptional regulator
MVVFLDWIKLEAEYRESRRIIQECIEKKKEMVEKTTIEIVDLEILSNMRGNLTEVVGEMGRRAKYEFQVDEKFIPLLTPRQQEIVDAVIRYRSCSRAAKAIGANPKTVFATWQTVVKKTTNWKRQERLGVPIGCSHKQEKIFLLQKVFGNDVSAIANELNISQENVREQLKRVRARINENVK